MTLITDPVSVHRSWLAAGADRTLVVTSRAAVTVQELGVPETRVARVRFPVHAEFTHDDTHRRESRKQLGITSDRVLILITGGGAGSGPIMRLYRELRQERGDSVIIVLAGTNTRLRRRLARVMVKDDMAIGVTDDVARYLSAADLVIGKAGPATIHECATVGVPLLIVDEVGPQEQGNANLAEQRAWARACSIEQAVGFATTASPRSAICPVKLSGNGASGHILAAHFHSSASVAEAWPT